MGNQYSISIELEDDDTDKTIVARRPGGRKKNHPTVESSAPISFAPGSRVRGHVLLDIRKKKRIRRRQPAHDAPPLNIQIHGQETTRIRSLTGNQSEECHRFLSNCQNFQSLERATRKPGVHKFAFDFEVPADAPASTMSQKRRGSDCRVQYTLLATYGGHQVRRTLQIAPVPQPPVPMIPCQVDPTVFDMKRYGLIRQGNIVAGARLLDSNVWGGDKLRMRIACRNESLVTIDHVSAKLVETIDYKAKEDSVCQTIILAQNENVQLSTICKGKRTRVEMNGVNRARRYRANAAENTRQEVSRFLDSTESELQLQVPQSTQLSYMGELIKISHHVEIIFSTGFASGKNPMFRIPICIGPSQASTSTSDNVNTPHAAEQTSVEEFDHTISLPEVDVECVMGDSGLAAPMASAILMDDLVAPKEINPELSSPVDVRETLIFSIPNNPPKCRIVSYDSTDEEDNDDDDINDTESSTCTASEDEIPYGSEYDALEHQHFASAPSLEDLEPFDADDDLSSNNPAAAATPQIDNAISNTPSLIVLLKELQTCHSSEYALMKRISEDSPLWRSFLSKLTPIEYGLVVSKVVSSLENQLQVACFLANLISSFAAQQPQQGSNFTCDHCIEALRRSKDHDCRRELVKLLLPYCCDLGGRNKNSTVERIRNELTDWDWVIAERAIQDELKGRRM